MRLVQDNRKMSGDFTSELQPRNRELSWEKVRKVYKIRYQIHQKSGWEGAQKRIITVRLFRYGFLTILDGIWVPLGTHSGAILVTFL